MTTAETKRKKLQALYNTAATCKICPYDKKEENHKVFGAGNSNARIFFIGEAPGKQEDLEKLPFVGRSGKLLNACMEKAGFSREDVFVTNIVKCRPPNNRTPSPEEITPAALELLKNEINIVSPRIICTVGATAARALLGHPVSMASLRGTVGSYHNIKVMHTYHPAYIFRNRAKEADLLEDLKKLYKLSQKD